MFAARGRLITESFAREVLPTLPGTADPPPRVRRAFECWAQRCDELLGPASSVRAVADAAAVPLLRILGFEPLGRDDRERYCAVHAAAGRARVAVVVTGWGQPLLHAWRDAVAGAVAIDAEWCLCCNGRSVRIVDGRRTWSRDHLELDIAVLGHDAESQWLLWSVARADVLASMPPLLDRIVGLAHRHGIDVCRALGMGVLDALQHLVEFTGARARDPQAAFEQSLTVLYRVLFLLFAEARGLLPLWHPVYRDRYSLQTIVTALVSGRPYPGLWHAVRAISRLAHSGCRAGELKVTAFNGRLFAPAHAAVFEAMPVPDPVMNRALIAVSTTPRRPGGGRARIGYRDLDVEQLGAVYEQVLDYEPRVRGRVTTLERTGDVRKATGTFYTPRVVTAFLVRRTLEPLVAGKTSAEILGLRVLDPAMGSGAFLVAACRFLALAAEEALVREGTWHSHDVSPADRAALRREIASTCLFGVDLNPMAVQLARLSLWLASLAGDKPLSFLDHHLVPGDSLVGGTPEQVARARTRAGARPRPSDPLPLFAQEEIASTLEHATAIRLRLSAEPDDSAAIVRSKERTLAALQSTQSPIGRWSRVLDLWCAGWFWDDGPPPDHRTFAELVVHILRGRSALPERVAAPLIARLADVAGQRRFLHWPLAFPELFADSRGEPLPNPGFDAVIGNPPWDMVRGDSGNAEARAGRRSEARQLASFIRASGVYRIETRAHVNRYQLFVERALQLAKAGGRVGLVLPSGAATDTGSAALRRHLFERADVDGITGIDNREGIFPIHRGLRFLLLSCTRRSHQPTPDGAVERHASIRCRFGITRAEQLEGADAAEPLMLTRALLARLSGADDLGIPELASRRDLELVERLVCSVPRLAAREGWGVQFGRELNASDDRDAFTPFEGGDDARPVVEGKLIEPFRVALDRCRLELRRGVSAGDRIPRRTRLAYRDVASATNRLTLIAALVPARAVTTHTLFCLRSPLPLAAQHVLCALLNSFVANYLVRLRVNTHVTLSLVSRLPVPPVLASDPAFHHLERLSRALSHAPRPAEELAEYGELQALAAHLYGLDAADFEHVLGTFPLVAPDTRRAALKRFNSHQSSLPHERGDAETRS